MNTKRLAVAVTFGLLGLVLALLWLVTGQPAWHNLPTSQRV
jgi:hypothetical protein